MIISTEIAIN